MPSACIIGTVGSRLPEDIARFWRIYPNAGGIFVSCASCRNGIFFIMIEWFMSAGFPLMQLRAGVCGLCCDRILATDNPPDDGGSARHEKRRCKQNANGGCREGNWKCRKAVSLLFSWSQRPDLNRGPTDYDQQIAYILHNLATSRNNISALEKSG